jgi:serine-type D-Ala-D-Ala carboxypeptidase/endopeptidase
LAELPPPLLSGREIERLLAQRVTDLRLSSGMIVGVVEDGRRRFFGRGVCDSESRRPISADIVFEIGSVTKLFTALLLADMSNRKEVTLDQPVRELLPYGTRVPARNGREMELRDLATHHAGFPRRPTNLEPFDPDDPYAAFTEDSLYEFLATFQLERTPGEVFEYSNVGSGLLGHALVRRAGAGDYETLVRERILRPLDMENTGIIFPSATKDRTAKAHDSSLDSVPWWNLGILAGAGALRSTAADMLTFLEAMVDPASPLGAMTPILLAPRSQGGLELGPPHPDAGISIAHSGGTGGTRSSVRYIPEWRRGVVVLSNSNVDAVIDLGVHILDPRFSPQWFRQEILVDPSNFDRVVGRYHMSPRHVFDVTKSNGRLFVQLSGQLPTRVFPSSGHEFFYKAINAQITFEPREGKAERLILHQNGSDQIALRIS